MNLGFDPAKVESLDSLGTVYQILRLSDAWGVLEVTDGGALIAGDWTVAILQAPDSLGTDRARGPGRRLELAPGWSVGPAERAGDFKLVKGQR